MVGEGSGDRGVEEEERVDDGRGGGEREEKGARGKRR